MTSLTPEFDDILGGEVIRPGTRAFLAEHLRAVVGQCILREMVARKPQPASEIIAEVATRLGWGRRRARKCMLRPDDLDGIADVLAALGLVITEIKVERIADLHDRQDAR